MAAEYLVAAANHMYDKLSKEPPTDQDFIDAATVACATLRRLADDQEFKSYVTQLTSRRWTEKIGFDLITRPGDAKEPLGHFIFFLAEEERVLLAAGIDPRLVKELIRQAKLLIESVRKWKAEATSLFVMVAEIRDQACDLKESLKEEKDKAVDKDAIRNRLQRIMLAVGGATIIVLNIVNPLNLTLAGSAVSAAVGGILIDRAIPELRSSF